MLQYSAQLKFQNLLYVNFNKKANNISFQRNIFLLLVDSGMKKIKCMKKEKTFTEARRKEIKINS